MNEYSGFGQHIAKATIVLAQSGDCSAMEEIYKMYANPCFSLANRITADQSAAQDIVHNVFVKVMKNIKEFNHFGTFAGWLRQIAVNESIAYINKNAKHSSNIELEQSAIQAEQPNASRLYEDKWWEACNDLNSLTGKLSDQARAVLFLHEIEGYSHKEIANLFDKTESFSKQSLARTMSQLRANNMKKEN